MYAAPGRMKDAVQRLLLVRQEHAPSLRTLLAHVGSNALRHPAQPSHLSLLAYTALLAVLMPPPRRMPDADEGLMEFVSHLLTVDPRKRPTAAEALKHPWLQMEYPSLDA